MSALSVPILMYHKVAPVNPRSTFKGHYVSPRMFARQMDLLAAKKYSVIPLANALSGDAPDRSVVLTFDDGYENFFLNALPVLVRHGFPSTVFLVANAIGGTNVWDSRHGDVSERLMDAPQIREAQHAGVEFGSHTLDHADLLTLSEDECRTQLSGSREKLRGLLGTSVDAFCYPYGRQNTTVRELVKGAGYTYACSTEKGPNTPLTDPFALRRINVRRDTYLPIFLYKLRRDLPKDG